MENGGSLCRQILCIRLIRTISIKLLDFVMLHKLVEYSSANVVMDEHDGSRWTTKVGHVTMQSAD